MPFRIDEFKKTASGVIEKLERTLYTTFGYTISIGSVDAPDIIGFSIEDNMYIFTAKEEEILDFDSNDISDYTLWSVEDSI